MPLREVSYRVKEQESGRADLLVARLLKFSRSQVRALADAGGIYLNGQVCPDASFSIGADDHLILKYDPQRRYREKSQPWEKPVRGFKVLFEDEDLIVVDKEAGLLTVPTDKREETTLIDRLSRYVNPKNPARGKVSVVHRLDRDTSGVLVFGKSPGVAADLIKQFAARKPERNYIAIVSGNLASERGEFRSHLSTDEALNQRSGTVGQLAITHFQVEARLQNASWVSVRLETGRRNQIRVHLAEAGHPILGDVRYRSEDARHGAWAYRRLALHAQSLGFIHPRNGISLRFEAPIPEEFLKFRRSTRLN